MNRIIPKTEIGRNPQEQFTDTGDPFGIKVGVLTRIDEVNLKGDLKILTGGGEQKEIDLTQAMYGPRSFWGGIPEVGSLCIIGYRKKSKQVAQAMILGFLPLAARAGLRFDPISPYDPSDIDNADDADLAEELYGKTTRYKRLNLKPGDVGGMSASGAEFSLTKDVRIFNRAGDGIEIRDTDRTLILQAIHKIDSVSGVFRVSGPARRSAMFLPTDVTKDGTLLTETDRYYGRDILKNSGPGVSNGGYKYSNTDGKVLDFFFNTDEFPPVTYSNGKRTFYPATNVASNFEDPETSLGALAYSEDRTEISHTTDATQEVREEIDGFSIQPPRKYIERVLGTVVGNDQSSTEGMRQYGRLLKPTIFDDVFQNEQGHFRMQEVPRGPHEPDTESDTTTGGYLFRLKPPNRQDVDTEYAFAVSKQGKVFANIPGSTVERYPSGAKNVSMEVNLEGALKAFIGAETSRSASVIASLAGGIIAKIGHLSSGKAMEINYGSSVDSTYSGVNDEDNLAKRETINGNESSVVSGDYIKNAQGSIKETANGDHSIRADTINHSASNGLNGNYGGISILSSGKVQHQYAQMVLETIVTQGITRTVIAGAITETIVAGARTYTTLAGATSWISPAGVYSILVGAGAYSVTVGAGAISMTAGAAVSIVAAAAVAITAGATVNITAPGSIILNTAQTLIGNPSAILGVSRGLPMMPMYVPSLDWVTGLPLMGSATFRSAL